jgi:REP-associated tyrosine transposase
MQPDEAAHRRLRLMDQILHLPSVRLHDAEELLAKLAAEPVGQLEASSRPESSGQRKWPHAPLHRLSEQGTYIVTAGTYEKAHFFRGADRLDYLEDSLLSLAKEAGWQLEAWAVFSNHYHFVAHAGPGSVMLPSLIQKLHGSTAREVNKLDGEEGRQVWFNYWDTQLTFEKSYLARLNYVHHNAVKHGLVRVANEYQWCSASWFERTANPAQVKTIYFLKTDRVKVEDDFEPL